MWSDHSIGGGFLLTISTVVVVLCGCGGRVSMCDNLSAARQRAELRAVSGSAKNMFDLGQKAEMTTYCAENGSHITRDPDLIIAYMWYGIALRYGHPLAKEARNRVSKKMTGRQVAEAQKRIAIWMENYGKKYK